MSRAAQAPERVGGGVFRVSSPKYAAVVLACLILPACATSGLGLVDPGVDATVKTASVEATAGREDADRLSDETTIRNAVSSADMESLGGRPVAWANSGTGSRGSIAQLVELQQGGALCRRFVASRESFDGVALFRGETCMLRDGVWQMQKFEPA